MHKPKHRGVKELKTAEAGSFIPANEGLRLTALRRYDILDTLPEAVFDDLTKLAAHLCGMPVALIVLVDEKRLWFKSRVGLTVAETPRPAAPCCYTILADDLLVVEDTHRDPRFAHSPLVTGGPHLRFYAGMTCALRTVSTSARSVWGTRASVASPTSSAAAFRQASLR